MTIETALFSYLTGKSEITSIVSTRVYATVAPSSPTYPYITFQMVSNNPEHHMSGNSPITIVRIQLDAWARTVATQQAISEAVRNALDGYRGQMGAEALDVRRAFLDNRNTFEEPDKHGKNLPVHRASLDFSIWHVEAVPTL